MVVKQDQPTGTVLSPDLQERLLEHPGKWVAMTKTELLGVGGSPDEVLHLAAEKGEDRPILYFVPPKGPSAMFF
jgi:hypothetical protein